MKKILSTTQNKHKKTESPAWGLTVIVASMHSFINFQKFKSPVTLTLT